MSEHTIRRCDECQAPHGEVNNWWCIVHSAEHPTFVTFEEAERMTKDSLLHQDSLRLDYCSHKCIGTAFHRWLDTGDVRLLPVEEGKDERP